MAVCANAQTDVTNQHIKNPDFEINYLTYWTNTGMQMQNNVSFEKHGAVYVEKWVAKGSKVGTGHLRQVLKNLPQGKYTLTVMAQNIQQDAPSKAQTGAIIYAGDAETMVTTAGDYSVDFTHLHGNITIGFKLTNATGNYACVDNFRLYRNGDAYEGAAEDDARMYQAERDSLADLYANASGATPIVTTSDYIGVGSTFALGRSTIKLNGATVKERGYCYSAINPEPTVLDSVTTYSYAHEGSIYVMEPLAPQTFYWVRPYAITKDNVVAYGEPKYIATLPKGGCIWSYGYEGDDEQNARIVQAINNGIVNYNDCMGLKGFELKGHYVYGAGAGGGTADCSYGGYMRISQSTSYQRTGTVQHEFAHGVGVGTRKASWGYETVGSWDDTNVHNWEWFGRRANDLAHFLENSKEVQVVGDGTHTWVQNTNGRTNKLINYGINGANEDDNTQLLYRANAMMVEALHEDGLCATDDYHCGTPAYSFYYQPGKKYYIKSKNAERGLYDSYLYQRAATFIGWKPFDGAEAVSDSAAWYIEYIPASGYYTFKNVETGKYLTHASGGSSVSLKTIAESKKPGATEYFQLMPDRKDVTIKQGSEKVTTHGYWFLWYDGGNKSMSANKYGERLGYGTVAQASLNFADTATDQQWIIISEDELDAYQAIAVASGISKISVNDSTPDGLKTVVGIYAVDGKELQKTQKGFNIIRYNDGTSKKIFVK